jgi:hypothetical protein
MPMSVPQKGLSTRRTFFLIDWFASLVIWSLIILIAVIDIALHIYQFIYFGIKKIPKVPRNKYVVIRRHLLRGLNFAQKMGCAYCEYTNGVILWAKAVANQTEIYSCAIKHSHKLPGQEYQEDFYEQAEYAKE